MNNSSHLKDRVKASGPSWGIVFLYMFAPMLITVNIPGPIGGSGSPIEDTQTTLAKSSTSESRSGAGGPEEQNEDFFIIEDISDVEDPFNRPLQFFVTGGKAPEVYRINYFKTVDARFPVDPSSKISSDFGWRTPPCDECSADHQGVDFVPGAGEPVYAILDGIVVEAGFLGGYGYWVKLEHIVQNSETGMPERWETVYAHLQEDSIPEDVSIGAVVEKGKIIGKVGDTGVSTGPHLHFEIRVEGENVDPLPMIASYEVYAVNEVTQELEIQYR